MSNQQHKEDDAHASQTKVQEEPRWRIWTRTRRPSLGRVPQPGPFGSFQPNGRDFGEDEYSDFADWVSRENAKGGESQHEIRAES
jgi:hypothetical protein